MPEEDLSTSRPIYIHQLVFHIFISCDDETNEVMINTHSTSADFILYSLC